MAPPNGQPINGRVLEIRQWMSPCAEALVDLGHQRADQEPAEASS